jgi:hypothetical protein
MQISNSSWPIPIHRHSRCRQRAVHPGQQAPHAFVDFRQVLAEMPLKQKVAAVEKTVYQLLENGAIKWSEAVGKYTVRALKEIVALTKIDVATTRAAGVSPTRNRSEAT